MIYEDIKKLIGKALEDLGVEVSDIHLEHPANMKFGDLSTNIAMHAESSDPVERAEKIKEKILEEKPSEIERIEVAGGGFLNFFLSQDFFKKSVEKALQEGKDFGKNPSLKGEKWLLEHTSPNPNKAMHIGHLRNNLTGMAVANIATWCGAEVIRDAIDNNRGIAIAKLMWGYLKFARKDGSENPDMQYWFEHQDEWKDPEEKLDRFVDELYVMASKDFEENEDVEKEVRQMVVDWENGDEMNRSLWKKVLHYSYEGQKKTLERLGNKWDKVWHEDEHYKLGKEFVEKGLERGIFKKLDDGAILTDLSSFGITDTVVQKSDGTALYITQDIALTFLKVREFHADKYFWVIGPEQTLAMKQVFAVCEQLGIGKNFVHLPYGYMKIRGVEGKVSSRLGNVVYIDDVLDKAKERVSELVQDRDIQEKKEVAEIVALGAVKYATLRVKRTMDMEFDVEKSTSLEGDTGPYVQYTCVRAKSVLNQSSLKPDVSCMESVSEVERLLYRFPEVVKNAASDYAPSYIATYVMELAAAFNRYYAEKRIISEDAESPYRLALTQAVSVVLENGLEILGIKVPEKM